MRVEVPRKQRHGERMSLGWRLRVGGSMSRVKARVVYRHLVRDQNPWTRRRKRRWLDIGSFPCRSSRARRATGWCLGALGCRRACGVLVLLKTRSGIKVGIGRRGRERECLRLASNRARRDLLRSCVGGRGLGLERGRILCRGRVPRISMVAMERRRRWRWLLSRWWI